MRKPILFSVVTISFNCVKEIEPTLCSVLGQSYPYIDYVVIDGKSNDGTMDIVNKYKDRISTIVSEKDSGIYNAMNKGLKHCKGDYVVFMNAGDQFASVQVLEKMNAILQETETLPSLIYGTYMETSKNIVIPNRNFQKCWYGMFASHQSIFYQLEFLRLNHICYDESYRIAADYKLTISVVAKTQNIVKTNICVAKFDTTGVSCTNPNLGLLEADRARKEVFGYGAFRRWCIRLMLYSARFAKNNLGIIYKKVRY